MYVGLLTFHPSLLNNTLIGYYNFEIPKRLKVTHIRGVVELMTKWKDTLNGLDYQVPEGELINKYRSDTVSILNRLCPNLTLSEINEGVDYAISTAYAQGLKKNQYGVKIHNNYTDRTAEMDLLTLSNEILTKKPIMTTQGVLFARHDSVKKRPFYNFIQYLLDKRNDAKNEMKKYPKGSEMYNKWNLKQLNYKVSCNALYGCAGQYTSVFYNLYLCTAVTGQGRGCISASITMFEGLLANNMKFASLNEVLQFIENVVQDQARPDMNRFNDWDVLDRNISIEECFLHLINNCGYNSWVPSDAARDIIWNTVNNLDQRVINVLYYKNNLYEFCNNHRVSNLVLTILTKLNEPFLNPNKVPKEVASELVMFKDLIYEYCYYRHIWIDKLERVYTMQRDVVLITDTDSCIVSLDEWYRFILAKTIGIPMKIKYTQAQIKEAADKVELEMRHTEPKYEYDFYNDELVEAKRKKYPLIIIEEDNLRYSIVDIMSYTVSQLILDYMVLFSENYNTQTEGRDCLLIMKNEFLFKSLLLTFGRKNYADLQLVQEGNIIPEDKQFDIKGMPISKVGIPESTSKVLKDILEFDILRSSFVDQIDIFKKLTVLEKQIYQSIKDKKKEFHKPARIKSMANYKTPMQIQGIKASYAYNEIKSHEEPEIDLNEMNTILIIKTKINKKNYNQIMEKYPEHYLRMKKVLEMENFKGKIDAIAIPFDSDIPDWLIPFIDYVSIIQDNLRNFPLDEIGMSKNESSDITHTNIVKL